MPTSPDPTSGEYEPSPWEFIADTVRQYEETGGREGGTLEGKPCVILTTTGRHSGKLRKTPLMRVEHDGTYAVVASMGGAPKHPVWYLNLLANPAVTFQDGDQVSERQARIVDGDEKRDWWARAVEVWPSYDDYQAGTDREIPLIVLELQALLAETSERTVHLAIQISQRECEFDDLVLVWRAAERLGVFAFRKAIIALDPPYDAQTVATLERVAAEIMPNLP